MKEVMGEYNASLKKLFGSFKKRFGLTYSGSLEYVDKIIEDKDYAILFFASDITYSRELIDEINSSGLGQAFGFYKDGPNNSLEEIKLAIPRIVGEGGNKFIFVELEDKSRFRLEEVPKTIFIKLGSSAGNLVVDTVKAREVVKDEVIKRIDKTDQEEFNKLFHTLYVKRWEMRGDIFVRNFKMSNSDLSRLCDKSNDKSAFVCYREGKLVGFIIYESISDKDSRAFEDRCYLTVRDIYVDEEYRRLGIATRLFREVTRLADKNRSKIVKFKTWGFDEETNAFVASLNKETLYTMHEISI